MQGDFSDSDTRFRTRCWIGGVLLLVLMGGVTWAWWWHRNEPRYLGRTEREWFPLRPAGSPPAMELTVASPAALPVLLSAVHRPDSVAVFVWNGLAERVSDFGNVNLQVVDPAETRSEALEALVLSATRPEFAIALMDRFSRLPAEDQRGILIQLGRNSTPLDSVRQLNSLLLRAVVSGREDSPWYAGRALLKVPPMARPQAGRLVSMAAEVLGKSVRGTDGTVPGGLPVFLDRLGDLGPLEPELIQPLIRELDALTVRSQSALHLKRLGLICRSRLAPELFPPGGYLESAMTPTERIERIMTLCTFLESMLRRPELPPDTETWFGLFLRFGGFGQHSRDSWERCSYRDRLLALVTDVSKRTRSEPSLQRALLAGMENPMPVVRRATAVARAQIETPAPEVVDRCAKLLMDGFEPDFMLRVLGNARVIPDSVEGLVRDLAAGAAPVNWTPRPTLSDESARRLNLPPVRESLSTLAKELLRKVEESSGSGVQR